LLSRLSRWFRRRPPSPVLRDPGPAIVWHGEQDGNAEREFKVRCVQLLRLAPRIRKAFLVRATLIGASEATVVLVLASAEGPDEALLRTTGELAMGLPPELNLTFMTLRPGDCAPIERVCSAFYYAA
jgi:hypothetical protein